VDRNRRWRTQPFLALAGVLAAFRPKRRARGPSISWRIFDRRQIRRNIEVQSELREQALIAYEATVLAALTEVEDALVALAQEQVRQRALTKGWRRNNFPFFSPSRSSLGCDVEWAYPLHSSQSS